MSKPSSKRKKKKRDKRYEPKGVGEIRAKSSGGMMGRIVGGFRSAVGARRPATKKGGILDKLLTAALLVAVVVIFFRECQ